MWSTKKRLKRSATGCCALLIFAVGFSLALIGCSVWNSFSGESKKMTQPKQAKGAGSNSTSILFNNLLEAGYAAADRLSVDFRKKKNKQATGHMLAASFVNINNLNESSPLGRVVSEQIASRLVQNGFRVLEMKLRQNSIYIKEGRGEFLLSREIKEISASHAADFVIVGTYAAGEKNIHLSARIVSTSDNIIIAACDFLLARNTETESLLRGSW